MVCYYEPIIFLNQHCTVYLSYSSYILSNLHSAILYTTENNTPLLTIQF